MVSLFKQLTLGWLDLLSRIPIYGRYPAFWARMHRKNFWGACIANTLVGIVGGILMIVGLNRLVDRYMEPHRYVQARLDEWNSRPPYQPPHRDQFEESMYASLHPEQ